jgi:signal transduction histidine kinase
MNQLRSLRGRLWTIVALLFVSLCAMVGIDRLTSALIDNKLDAIQGELLPLLQYGPKVDAAFDDVTRRMQDAVAAQDAEVLEAAAADDSFLALLRQAPVIVDRARLAQVERQFVEWRGLATEVSWTLLRGEGGESVIAEIEAMQEAQRATKALLAATVFLDETALSAAFQDARTAQRRAALFRNAFHTTLFAAIATLVLLTGRRVVSSFADLHRGFSRFGGGDFTRPIAIRGTDELAVLGRSADQMASRIEELQAGLRAKQRALEESNRELESFSYSVSHDLRAPLPAIDGFSMALLEDCGELLDDAGRGHLERVRAAAKRMAELIDDLLALSRITRGEVRREPVDLSEIVTRTSRSLQDADPARTVAWTIAPGLRADADRRLVAVALENLVGNAWKFTSKRTGARIEFGLDRDGVFFVRDNGAGFDMAHAEKLFGAFQRLHRQSDYEGTGIGLATVQRVVQKHGGAIWAEAQIDRGATFFFTLDPSERA